MINNCPPPPQHNCWHLPTHVSHFSVFANHNYPKHSSSALRTEIKEQTIRIPQCTCRSSSTKTHTHVTIYPSSQHAHINILCLFLNSRSRFILPVNAHTSIFYLSFFKFQVGLETTRPCVKGRVGEGVRRVPRRGPGARSRTAIKPQTSIIYIFFLNSRWVKKLYVHA